MSIIVETSGNAFHPEYRGFYQPVPTAHVGVIVQGSALSPVSLKGHEDDSEIQCYEMRLLVGPYWRDVQSVVPKVTIDGFYSSNPDQDDFMRWTVRDLTWDTVGEFGPSNDELRIRLNFEILVQGEHAIAGPIGYFLMASGRRLGVGGINEPGPVNRQG